MTTLCNACGINYSRAVKKEGKPIDLDELAKDRNLSSDNVTSGAHISTL